MDDLNKWVDCLLGDILTVRNGYAFKSTEYQNEGIPIIRISDIKGGIVEVRNSKCISQNDEFENYAVSSGDVLIAMSGATTGKFGVYKGSNRVYQNQRVGNLKLISDSLVNKQFIYYLLHSLKRKIEKDAYGGAQPNISGIKIEQLEISLPPLLEQQRIVTKIESLFSELDNGIESLKTAREQMKIYRQALLKHAFSGKLTEQWRAENKDKLETAEALLKRIHAEREQSYQQRLKGWETKGKQGNKPKAPKILPPLTAEELAELAELPESWAWVKVGEISDVQLSRQRSPGNRSNKYPTKYIRAGNITENGLKLDDVLDMEFDPLERKRFLLGYGDILLSEASGSANQVGKPAIWRDEITGCCFQNTVIRVRSLTLNEYLFWVFKTYYVTGMFSKLSGGVGINHLSAGKLESMGVPIVGKLESEKILELISEKLSVIENVDQTLITALQQAEALRQSILKKAFSGQLVPQDPSDEPASVLLERIQAEKVKLNIQTPSNRGKKTVTKHRSPSC